VATSAPYLQHVAALSLKLYCARQPVASVLNDDDDAKPSLPAESDEADDGDIPTAGS
jgi:hypothetical protein